MDQFVNLQLVEESWSSNYITGIHAEQEKNCEGPEYSWPHALQKPSYHAKRQ